MKPYQSARAWLLAALAAFLMSCASWWARTPEHVVDVGKILGCVMAEYDAGTKILDIVARCGLRHEQEVLDLVTAQKTAEARHAKAGAAAGCPSASASASSSAPAPTPSSSASAKPAPSSSVSAAQSAGSAK